VPEENLGTLWCKGRLTEADTHTETNKQTPLKTSTSLRYAMPVGKNDDDDDDEWDSKF